MAKYQKMQTLDQNKAHGPDGESVRMLRVSCPSIVKPRLVIFYNCLHFGTFSEDWK